MDVDHLFALAATAAVEGRLEDCERYNQAAYALQASRTRTASERAAAQAKVKEMLGSLFFHFETSLVHRDIKQKNLLTDDEHGGANMSINDFQVRGWV